MISVGVIIALFAVLGSAHKWRENRRILNQEARSSDTWAALGVAPFTGLGGILSTAVGLALGPHWRGGSGFSFPEASTSLSVCPPILDSSPPPSVILEHGGSRSY